MARKESLFAILSRSPWWLSIAIGAVLFSVLRLVLPDLIAASAGVPFLAIGAYAGWRQLRTPGPARIARVNEALRAMSWQEFSPLIEEAFRREGYTVTRVGRSDVDFELAKGARVSVVSCKRWKAASTGVGPLRTLYDACRAREASECVYVSTGEFTAGALEFAAGRPMRLVRDVELARLVGRAALLSGKSAR